MILTTGLSGSSVLTGVITQAGYWCGDKTEYKDNNTGQYETYENSQFVQLNVRLVELLGIEFDSKSWYDESLRDKFTQLYSDIDLSDFQKFITDCSEHQTWVLKDPKLWLTIGFWLQIFQQQEIQVVILTRNINQLWVSQTSKRIIYDYSFLKNSEQKSKIGLIDFLNANNVEYLELEYDQLLRKTKKYLGRLNEFLTTDLSLNDWFSIYKKQKNSSVFFSREIKAILIYLKNYSLRIR